MKKILFILAFSLVIVDVVFADDAEKKSIIGKMIDETVSPLKYLLTPSQRLDPIVITPSRYEESSLDVNKNVTVIDSEKIKKSHARSVPELIKNETGVVVRDYMGNGKSASVDLRGFGESAASNVLVLIDGRRTNQIDLSGPDLVQLNVDSIERIEIVRGAQSVLYGDNAPGGVINIITKTGKGKEPEIGFQYRTGSYRYNSYSGFIDGGNKFLDYYGSLSHSYTNGYRTNNNLEADDFNGNIALKPNDDFHFNIRGGYHRDWYGQPGSLYPSDIDTVGWRGSVTPNDRAKTEDAYLMAGPEIKQDIGFGEIKFFGDIITRSRRTASLAFYSDGTNSEGNNHIRTVAVTPKLAFTADFLGFHNRMIAGLDYYHNKDGISSTHFDTDDGINYFMNGKDIIDIEKDTLGLYMTDTIDILPNFTLNAGYRVEWANYRFDQQAMVSGLTTKRLFENAVETGVNFKYNERSAVYASYSRSYRFPAVDEWYTMAYKDSFTGTVQGGLNTDLEQQTGNNYEIGIKENSSKYFSLKADYFIMDLKHELYFNPLTYANSIYDHTMHRGLEFEGHTYLFDVLDCFANYTYEQAYFVSSSYAGHDIPIVPRHKFSSGFDYTFMNCVNVNYIANFIGIRRFVSDVQNFAPRLKSYLTHDIKISYYKYGLEIYGAMYNIFDEKYSEYGVTNLAGTKQVYYPSPGKNFLFGVKAKF